MSKKEETSISELLEVLIQEVMNGEADQSEATIDFADATDERLPAEYELQLIFRRKNHKRGPSDTLN